jgi:MATE family multidrug resistance protein
VPLGLSILIEVSGFSLMAVFIARMGVVASAGHQIAANLTAILFMVPLALAQASMTLVAQRIGAGDVDDARRLGWHGLRIAVVIAALMSSMLFLGRGAIAGLYSQDAAVLAVAVPLLGWLAAFHVVDAVQAVASFVLRAYRITLLPMLIYAGSLWGLGLGGGYVLAFNAWGIAPRAWQGTVGYWLAATVGLFVAGTALLGLLIVVLRRQGHAVNPRQPAASA